MEDLLPKATQEATACSVHLTTTIRTLTTLTTPVITKVLVKNFHALDATR